MPRALIFDVFGTLVDWRTSIARQMAPHMGDGDPATFADAWRARYQPAMEAVRSGARPFVRLDTLHRENLDAVLDAFAMNPDAKTRDEMNLFWHRLDGWPDVAEALIRLQSRFVLAPHSNGNVRLMLDIARHNGWRWDCILGAETTGHYKPVAASYARCADILMLPPAEVMMVAAHNSDLAAARACGLATAFFPRPQEHGIGQRNDLDATEDWDIVAADLSDLAERLGV